MGWNYINGRLNHPLKRIGFVVSTIGLSISIGFLIFGLKYAGFNDFKYNNASYGFTKESVTYNAKVDWDIFVNDVNIIIEYNQTGIRKTEKPNLALFDEAILEMSLDDDVKKGIMDRTMGFDKFFTGIRNVLSTNKKVCVFNKYCTKGLTLEQFDIACKNCYQKLGPFIYRSSIEDVLLKENLVVAGLVGAVSLALFIISIYFESTIKPILGLVKRLGIWIAKG